MGFFRVCLASLASGLLAVTDMTTLAQGQSLEPVIIADADSEIQFVQPPRLIHSTTTEKTADQLWSRYFFTIEVPPNAGASLKQVDFALKLGVRFPRFSTRGTRIFTGRSKKGDRIPIESVMANRDLKTVAVTLERPVEPGETVTVMLKTIKNPSAGTYQYEVRGHAPGSQSRGQYIGLGRIEIRPRLRI
ncbi:MAG: DUF2808 domain-containing protein [Cyanobacteria bacterium P01_F01_bin.42]